MSVQTTNWRRKLPEIDTVMIVLFVVFLIALGVEFASGKTAVRNCEYFQTRLSALRECATLPNCTVDSDDFAYAVSREKRWCEK